MDAANAAAASFELRVYDPQGPSNYPVAPLQKVGEYVHQIDLSTLPGGTFVPGAIYQIYPARKDRCFYDPFPKGMRWYCMTAGQTLAVIDAHDQYAYFTIPMGSTTLKWELK
jgi:hypothetical protein